MKEENPPGRTNQRRSRGFTLVELLVVISIMAILMTAGAIGMNGVGGKGVTSGVATAESLFDEARSIAMSKGVKSRVLVLAKKTSGEDEDEASKKNAAEENLRRIVVVYQATNADGTVKEPEEWLLASRSTVLPDQVFFSDKFSRTAGNDKIGTIKLEAPFKAAMLGDYYSYEFNREGICATPGASFVIGTGARRDPTQPPQLTGAAKKDLGGFVIWRNGSTSIFRSPDQIKDVATLAPKDEF